MTNKSQPATMVTNQIERCAMAYAGMLFDIEVQKLLEFLGFFYLIEPRLTWFPELSKTRTQAKYDRERRSAVCISAELLLF